MLSQKDRTAAARPTPITQTWIRQCSKKKTTKNWTCVLCGLHKSRWSFLRTLISHRPRYNVLELQWDYVPLNMGASFHTPSPPIEVYWPREHSSRNKGTPANMRVKKYGIKKAPGWTKSTSSYTFEKRKWKKRRKFKKGTNLWLWSALTHYFWIHTATQRQLIRFCKCGWCSHSTLCHVSRHGQLDKLDYVHSWLVVRAVFFFCFSFAYN